MRHSKLILLLQTFSTSELRAFKDFVESPFFNKNKELIRLNRHLKKLASKDFPESKLTREAVFKAVYPGQTYDDKQLNYAMSLLLKLAERFVGLQRYERAGILPDYHLLGEYVQRGLDKNYHYIFQQASDKAKANPHRDAEYYFQGHLLSEVADVHFSRQNIRRYDPNLQQATDFLDAFFLAKKLRYLCNMLDQQKFISTDYQLNMLDEIKHYLESHDFSRIPAIHLYHLLLLALTEPEPGAYFENYTRQLRQSATHFSPGEQRSLYHFAINFCIHQIRLGDKKYTQNLMDLYREGVDNQVLLEDGQLSPWTFKNMVKLGLGLGRYDWVEDFVTHYSEKLDKSKRTDAYHFNLADLNYHRKNYDLALQHLNQVEFSDIHYHLGVKVMLLKIYYESREDDAFQSLVSTFKIFLHRNKNVPGEVKEPYLNFVNLLHELYKSGKEKHDMLRKKVQETRMLTDRSWLLQQLD